MVPRLLKWIVLISVGLLAGCPVPHTQEEVSLDIGVRDFALGTGTVGVAPEGSTYFRAQVIHLEASPEPGYEFSGWYSQPDGGALLSSEQILDTSLNADSSYYASFTMNLEPVSGGTFTMGDTWDDGYDIADELPSFSASVDAFQLGRYEVTLDQICRVFNYALENDLLDTDTGDIFGPLTESLLRLRDGSNTRTLLNISTDDTDLLPIRLIRTNTPDPDAPIDYVVGYLVPETGYGDICGLQISWYGAIVFCNVLSLMEGLNPVYDTSDWSCNWNADGYRLPTEAEWAFAVRGGIVDTDPYALDPINSHETNSQYSGGTTDISLSDVAWTEYSSNTPGSFPIQGNQGPHPVGGKIPNELGLYDMTGNVYEWCWDYWEDGYYASLSAGLGGGTADNPLGPATGTTHVIRGGYWGRELDMSRIAVRHGNNSAGTFSYVGLRVARNN